MYPILSRKELSPGVVRFEVEAPIVARKRKPGQFAIVRAVEGGERIPLSITDADPERGVVVFVVREIGTSTEKINAKQAGDHFLNVVGPLGQATEIENFGTVVCVGGGVGIAPLYPIIKALKEAGNRTISILGGRDAQQVILREEVEAVSDELMICTDDGSLGEKGVVTKLLAPLLERKDPPGAVFTIGPAIMMKFVCELTRPYGIKTIVSLNSLMVDGTGMCGGCRVSYDDTSKFVCVDGPEFDGHKVDFDNMLNRLTMYRDFEKRSLDRLHECSHQCHLDKAEAKAAKSENN